MATIPSFECVLLEAHKSLGLGGSKEKHKLLSHKKPWNSHQELIRDLSDEVFDALGLDESAKDDIALNLITAAAYDQVIKNQTWTYGASQQQVAWFMAAYVYIPSFARHMAFWSFDDISDSGMPGGEFWYLPTIMEAGDEELTLPVSKVINWLLDLLGQPMNAITGELGGGYSNSKTRVANVATDSIERVLYSWLKGDIPRATNFDRYFAEGSKLEFKGIFEIPESSSKEEVFQACLEFLTRKELLNPEFICTQIPVGDPQAIQMILDGDASDDIKLGFAELIAIRYAKPSLRLIRQRLVAARAFQDAYCRFGKFLQGNEFDRRCSDPAKNKALQLISIFQYIYNLTIEAHKNSQNEHDENKYFESKIPPYHKSGLFLSIDTNTNTAPYLAEKLTKIFFSLSNTSELEDHIGWDANSEKEIALRNLNRDKQQANDFLTACRLTDQMLKTQSFNSIKSQNSYWVLYHIANDKELPQPYRELALLSLYEICSSPNEEISTLILELGQLLDMPDRTLRPKNAKENVSKLLKKATSNPAYPDLKPMVDWLEAKHYLALKNFEKAQALFDQALDACQSAGIGLIEGEIARDAFALKIYRKPNGFNIENNERYYRKMIAHNCFDEDITFRNMLSFSRFEGDFNMLLEQIPDLNSMALWLEDYFHNNLFEPYD